MDSQQDADAGTKQGSSNPPVPPPTSVTASEQASTTKEEKKPSEERINVTINVPPTRTKPVEWWQLGISAGLAVIGVFAICIYGGQLQQMKIATKAAKDSATAALLSAEALRPSLAIAFLTPAPMTANGFPMDNGRLHVTFQIPNYGPVAAQNAQICEFDDVRVPTEITRLPYANCQSSSVWTFGNPMIPPTQPNGAGQGGGGMNGTKNLTSEEIRGLKKGTLLAVFSVLAIYDDAAGKQHHAESCVIFTFQPKWGTGSADSQTIGSWSSKSCTWKPQND